PLLLFDPPRGVLRDPRAPQHVLDQPLRDTRALRRGDRSRADRSRTHRLLSATPPRPGSARAPPRRAADTTRKGESAPRLSRAPALRHRESARAFERSARTRADAR